MGYLEDGTKKWLFKSGNTEGVYINETNDLVVDNIIFASEICVPEEFIIQTAASGVNPPGGVGDAVLVNYGVGIALEYANTSTEIASLNYRLPANLDTGSTLSARIAFACPTPNGNVRWGLKYRYVDQNEDCTIEDGEVLATVSASTVADGMINYSFILPAPSEDDRVVLCRLIRYGGFSGDTNGGVVEMLGISLIGMTTD